AVGVFVPGEGEIFAQRFDADGSPTGTEFQVNTYTTSYQQDPAVAVAPAGGFLVVWASGPGGSVTDIQGQRYDAGGLPLGGEFLVNSYTTGLQFAPAAMSDAAGRFVVVWGSAGSSETDLHGTSIQARRFDAGGTPVGGQFQVNSYTTGNQYQPAIAVDDSGDFVVAWTSEDGTNDAYAVSTQAQRFDAGGSAMGAQIQVSFPTADNQRRPQVAREPGGGFVVVWESDGSLGPDVVGTSIQGHRYDASGVPVGSQFQVNSYRNLDQRRPAVVAVDTDAFIALWDSEGGLPGSDESGLSVHGQLFAANGLLAGRRATIVPARVAKFVAKPAVGNRFTLPAADPLATGGALRFVDTGVTAGDDTYALPAGGWRALGNPPGSRGYRYTGAGTVADPCRVILVTDRIIKATCRGPGVTLTPPFAGDAAIELSLGPTDRYCARLGGDVLKNDSSGARWRDAALPDGCF
ncbi:MAG: hypothetical protein ACREKH_16845, partial [Candidatus Rokuibacteriota bacterium]